MIDLKKNMYGITIDEIEYGIADKIEESIHFKNSERKILNKAIKTVRYVDFRKRGNNKVILKRRSNIRLVKKRTYIKDKCYVFQLLNKYKLHFYYLWSPEYCCKESNIFKKNIFFSSWNLYIYRYVYLFRKYNNIIKFKDKFQPKIVFNNWKKNMIKLSVVKSYFKYFKYYAFSQQYLLFYLFEINYRSFKYKIETRWLKRVFTFFITSNYLKTLKLLKFYKRKVKSKRYYKRR